MKKILTSVFTALAIFAVNAKTHAQMTKFAPYTYVSVSKAGMNAAEPNYVIYSTTTPESNNLAPLASFSIPTTPDTKININGVGLNAQDSLMYGASWSSSTVNTIDMALASSLYRIDAAGNVQSLGVLPIPAGGANLKFINFAAGTMSPSGSYYYTAYGFKASGVAKLLVKMALPATPLNLQTSDLEGYLCRLDNVKDLPANLGGNAAPAPAATFPLDFTTNPDVNTALQAYLNDINANFPLSFQADGGLQDIDFNPTNSKLFGYISYPDAGTTVGRLVEFVSAPVGSVQGYRIETVGTTVNTQPGQELAGLMVSLSGKIYSLFTTGHYAEVDAANGSLGTAATPLAISPVPTSGGNLRGDLARAFVPPSPLPVNLLSFTAKESKSSIVELNWVSAQEINFKQFEVEHSLDSRNWTKVGSVAGQSSAIGKSNYVFNHNNPENGKNYYRLKLVDNDGSFDYSPIAMIMVEQKNGVEVFPNPVNNQLNIKVNGLNVSTIAVYELNGKLKQTVATTATTINTTGWNPGTYIVEIVTADGQKISKSINKL